MGERALPPGFPAIEIEGEPPTGTRPRLDTPCNGGRSKSRGADTVAFQVDL